MTYRSSSPPFAHCGVAAMACEQARPIVDRMREALAALEIKWAGKRRPKAFYLQSDDWAEFTATDPPTSRFAWGNNPTVWRDEPVFQGLPVRVAKSSSSKLYDHTTQGRLLPPAGTRS